MASAAAQLNRLVLLVERLLDAELLLDADGTRLLTETKAACLSLEAGDTPAVRQHIEQIVCFTEALVAAEGLARTNGHTVVETARRVLNTDTD